MTGSGTFLPGATHDVTGGGTYVIQSPDGGELVKGTYQVTRLLFWQMAEGAFAPQNVNHVADAADARAGLAILAVDYSDGRSGTLTISCNLVGSAPQIFEGIIANHAFAYFYNSEPPQGDPFVDANRTLFHEVSDS